MARIIIHNQCPIFQFEDLVGSLHGGRITQNFHKFKPEMKFLFDTNGIDDAVNVILPPSKCESKSNKIE